MNADLTTTIMVPTLWRSHHIGPLLENLHANHGDIPIKILFLCQDTDCATLAEIEKHDGDYMVFPSTPDGQPMSMVAKCNAMWLVTDTPFLFGCSDDIRLHADTLARCHEALMEPDAHIACVSDGIPAHNHSGELTGHCLIRCSYIREQSGVMDQPNTLMHPGYVHYYSDLELMCVARARGVYRSLFDARIDHPHANNGTAERDRVQAWTVARRRQDALTFRRRAHMWQGVAA